MPSGSDHEPSLPADQLVRQMREVTDKLRDQAWMVAPLSGTSVPAQPEAVEDAGNPVDG